MKARKNFKEAEILQRESAKQILTSRSLPGSDVKSCCLQIYTHKIPVYGARTDELSARVIGFEKSNLTNNRREHTNAFKAQADGHIYNGGTAHTLRELINVRSNCLHDCYDLMYSALNSQSCRTSAKCFLKNSGDRDEDVAARHKQEASLADLLGKQYREFYCL